MPIRVVIGSLFALVFCGSIAWRAALGQPAGEGGKAAAEVARQESRGQRPENPIGVGSSLVDGNRPAPREAPAPTSGTATPLPEGSGALEDFLPVVTEASFFGFLGFALGYASKKILKLAMIFIALFFALLQGLVLLRIASVDWSRAVELANGLVMNLKQDQSFTKVITDRIPSAATLITGFLVGFRRG